eukprot:gnl/TRDRNA2_/TRDRNA2_191987_c0_seq1.p1 gnl/TRDRNA2_/TRDRNA2_191987_c0~~gnl/TRDRNA2_/TRDRNA2_191987_c0_seq1.p1  ORF type:complete len:411 (-),score=78.78 gnl/TRDRNA2_/TRDRNA2_191987_c0_seq1:130-1362(-)
MAPVLRLPAARLLATGILLLVQAPLPYADDETGAKVVAGRAWESERDLVAFLSGLPKASKIDDEIELLHFCVSRSWWPAARQVVALAHARGSSKPGAGKAAAPGETGIAVLHNAVTKLVKTLKASADELDVFAASTYRDQTKGGTYAADAVHCALQWAQNATHVFLAVKYARRWSAPSGFVEESDLRVNTTSCCFHLEGSGHHSEIHKRYLVNVTFFEDVRPEGSTWAAAAAGRMTATFPKATEKHWPRLTMSKNKTAHPISKWVDMQERWDKLKAKPEAPPKTAEKAEKAKPKATSAANKTNEKPASGKDSLKPWYETQWNKFLKRARSKITWLRKAWKKQPAAAWAIVGVVASLPITWLVLKPSRPVDSGHASTSNGVSKSPSERMADAAEQRISSQSTEEQASCGDQ